MTDREAGLAVPIDVALQQNRLLAVQAVPKVRHERHRCTRDLVLGLEPRRPGNEGDQRRSDGTARFASGSPARPGLPRPGTWRPGRSRPPLPGVPVHRLPAWNVSTRSRSDD
jgi:hypothetical protein